MSKNRPGNSPGGKFGFWNFFVRNKLKTVRKLVVRGSDGPDWARTSDPALIKRML